MPRLAMLIFFFVFGAEGASAEYRITEDRGGQIGEYLRLFQEMRAAGTVVVIDGMCLSACTLALGILPRAQVCATEQAKLGFHAAWRFDEQNKPVPSPEGTRALLQIYPPAVRRWIAGRGGLGPRMKYLIGKPLRTIVRSCTPKDMGQVTDHRAQAR